MPFASEIISAYSTRRTSNPGLVERVGAGVRVGAFSMMVIPTPAHPEDLDVFHVTIAPP